MIGIYGGTFDPPHLGHLHLIKTLLERFSFTKFYIVPTSQNPLKNSGPQITADQRLMLLKAAAEELGPKVEILDWEIKKIGPSYTIDTLNEISKKESDPLVFVMGSDLFPRLLDWKNPLELLKKANFLIVQRTRENMGDPQQLLHKVGIFDSHFTEKNHLAHSQDRRWLELCEIDALPFSSSEIRQQLAEMWKKNKLDVPPQGIQRSVWLLIKENRLYTVG